jgi:hypothetical protein
MHGLRTFAAGVGAAALALAAVTAAGAANPQVERFTFGPTVSADEDFCGTGQTVTETSSAHLTVWMDPNQPVGTRNQSVSDDVLVSQAGVTVTTHSAYSFTDVLVSGDPNGTNTHEWTFKGAAQVTRIDGGGVVARDSGDFVVDTTWDGPEFDSDLISAEVVKDAGGHTHFSSDFCALMVPALGLG